MAAHLKVGHRPDQHYGCATMLRNFFPDCGRFSFISQKQISPVPPMEIIFAIRDIDPGFHKIMVRKQILQTKSGTRGFYKNRN
jgi:hypothetical protein